MANRRVSQQVQELFEKYMQTDHAPGRRLPVHDAIKLLTNEFKINESKAQIIFAHFDKDGNGAMSLWEFQHLYNVVGPNCQETIDLYESIDSDKKGYLTTEQVKEVLTKMTLSTGENLDAKEIEMFAKTAGTEGKTTLGDFIDLKARLKMFKRPKRK
ncbi:hypothetical protein CAPTEDRAFT_208528 [Capitella teleta]|uniref:EF-hand domain-containing protein n=1 Tax=Capitella teleta TaxID=283909 RepID=R7TFP9_CAPTE|nr:hypothetical protein CAPTEDRAFT_228793 [Capitella teleta]ELT92618.1 hypothetical protein CAPTEDRAFT_208528 [Capitella teleta]|eukprot:ELT87255.1 hypothetical protein CAPTEDRAFT_228793 [Capitella teleta]